MSWADDEIAGPMGYQYAVLFQRARDALAAYSKPIDIPENICPILLPFRKEFRPVNQWGECGLPVHLYGYQEDCADDDIALDPLLTGWRVRLKAKSAIVSFGREKMVNAYYGGALLTNDLILAERATEASFWNEDYTPFIRAYLKLLKTINLKRFDQIALWDALLGDSLLRVPREQIMPWRVMRRMPHGGRNKLVRELRENGVAVGTNYPSLGERNEWGDTVINFLLSDEIDKPAIEKACEIVKRVVYNYG